jgi:hypothetical protein
MMADDQPFYSPTYKLPPPEPRQPGELLFEFLRGHDRFLCELRDRGTYGTEAQFFHNETFYLSRRFDTRDQAVAWAHRKRRPIEHGPCPRCDGGGWLCAAHPDQVADHDPCHSPAMACPTCQAQSADETR